MRLNEIISGDIPDSVQVTLAPHGYQLEDLKLLLSYPRSSNYSEVGTGKSLVSYLWIMAKLYAGKKVIVVMPPALIPQYMRNFGVIEGHDFDMQAILKDRGKRHSLMNEWEESGSFPDVLFMSYQLFVKYARYLADLGVYKAIVADEAHVLANAPTKTFQAIFMAVHLKGMDLLTMTATPIITELRSAYGHIKLKTPTAYKDLAHFDREHTIFKPQEGLKVKQVAGYRQVEIIEDHLNKQSVRRRASDVLSLTEPTLIEHYVRLSDEHYQVYRKLLQERILELGDEILVAKNAQALRQMALQIVTNIEAYTDMEIDDQPLENLKAIVESVQGKVAVFCHFRQTVRKLDKVFKHLNPALVYGDSHVQDNVDKFLNAEDCRLIILNYQSGGAGFNLQSACNHTVFFEATGSPGQLEQALGRTHRQGQTKPVVAWLFNYMTTKSSLLFGKAFARSENIKTVMEDDLVFVDYLRKEVLT